MDSTIAIDVAAPPDLVFDLAHDVTRWERLLPHYTRSRVVATRGDGTLVVDFLARRPLIPVLGLGLPVAWRSRTWSDRPSRRLRFVHLAGATKGMDVTWRIDPVAGGTHVAIDHTFAPRLPLLAAIVDRFFTRPIAGRTLGTFKALAEALAAGVDPSDEPTQPAR